MRGTARVGLGLRREISADLLRQPEAVDFVEVVAEACFAQARVRKEAIALRELWPVVVHGVKLSLGSAEGIERERVRALAALARELRTPIISEHVAFVRSGGREIGHLTAVPFTRAALSVVERNVARARRGLPDVPLLLENVAWTFRWPDSELCEGDFYSEIVERTGSELLLDVGNLYANAVNSGLDPLEHAARFPLERVGMIHLAGGVLRDGFYFDDHAHAVLDDVFALLAGVLERTGPVPVLIERDAAFPPFSELQSELERTRRLLAAAPAQAAFPTRPRRDQADGDVRELARAQDRIAQVLTDVEAAPRDLAERFGHAALERARAVLLHKRVDEALSLLPRLARRRSEVEPLAHQWVRSTPRTSRYAAFGDALAIAERARDVPELRAAATRDRLLLRARLVIDESGGVRPRLEPFVGREPVDGGGFIWCVKGPGRRAAVRLFERGASA